MCIRVSKNLQQRKAKAVLYKGYVKVKDKQCIEKFKKRTDFKTYEQVKSLLEFAGILAIDTMFIDIDNGLLTIRLDMERGDDNV